MERTNKQLAIREQGTLLERVNTHGLDLPDLKMNTIEFDSRTKIPRMDAADYKPKAETLLKYLWKDLGLQGVPELYDNIRFCEFLLKFFPDFSLDEVKLSFEYWIAGELESVIASNVSHYGRWSIDFASKILIGYRIYRRKTRNDVNKLLPSHTEREATPEEKRAIEKGFMTDLRDALISAKNGGDPFPSYWYSSFIFENLCKVGLAKPVEVEKENYDAAFGKALASDRIGSEEKQSIREKYAVGSIGTMLTRSAISMKVEQEVKKILEEKSSDEIRDAFENYQPTNNDQNE